MIQEGRKLSFLLRKVFFGRYHVPTYVKDFSFQENIKHIFGGNQICSRTREFKINIFLVGLLLCEDFDLVAHLLVHF